MKILSLITLLLFIVSCTSSTKQQNKKQESKNSNYEIYVNDSLNVSFIKLTDWNIMENFHDIPVFYLSPRQNEQDFYQENITIVNEDIHESNLSEYYNNNIKGLQSFLTDFKIIQEEDWINKNGRSFKKLIYTNTSQGYTFKVLVFFTIIKQKGYVINCTALDTTFNNYYNNFNSLAESFKFN